MASVAKWLFLYLAFTAEVKVHAEDVMWMREPEHCGFESGYCSWLALQSKASLEFPGQSIVATRKSIFEWSAKMFNLVEGDFLWRADQSAQLRLPSAVIAGHGLAMIEKKKNAVKITVLEGEFQVRPLNSKEQVIVPLGYQVRLGPIRIGEAPFELPQLAPVQSTLLSWSELYPGDKKSFRDEARRWLSGIKERAELASQWQLDSVERSLASERQRQFELQRRRAEEEKSRQEMRALFRKLNYLD